MTDQGFGRVTEDGTVFVTLPDGTEAQVGQWAAGSPEDGLAFFRLKYDGLHAEAVLLLKRLRDGKATADSAASVVTKLRTTVRSPNVVGDLAELSSLADQLEVAAEARRAEMAAARQAAKEAATAARLALVEEAESLAQSTAWKATGDRFKELQAEWSALPRTDRSARDTEQEMWKRFSAARSTFDKARRSHFATLDATRKEAVTAKELLIARAEELSRSTDWNETARAYRNLMDDWKAAPRGARTDEDKLWARFRAAQDVFFAARSAALDERDGDQRANAEKKNALAAQAEALLPITDAAAARRELRRINEEWSQVGHVPRSDKEALEARIKRVEDAIRRYEDDAWRRTDPAKRALAESTAGTFRASLAKLESQHAAAVAAGDTRRATDLAGRVEQTKALLEAAERSVSEYGG